MADTDYGSLMDSAATPQPQGTQDSDYGALMDDETKAQATLAVASGASIPQDRAVQNAILAKRYRTSPAVVDAYPDDFRRQALLEDTRNQLAAAPKLASTIAQNPHAVDLVQGQIGQLAQMEQVLQPRGLIPDIWAGLQHTGTKVLGAWDKGAVALDQWIQQNLPWLHENVPGFMSPEEQQAYQTRGEFLQQRANWEENMPQRWTGNVTSVVPYLFFGGAAPAVMGGTEGSATTQNLEDQGVDEQTAQRAGAAEGALTALTAMLPMGKLRWGEGAMPLAKSFLAGSAKAGGVGAVQSVSTDEAVKAILDSAGYTDLAQQYSPTLSKAADSALFMGAFHLGSEGGQRLMMGHLADIVRANKAQNDAQRLETISQISQQATLRQGDPELFKQTVQSMAEDGDLHTVYVDGRTFQQSLDNNGISEEELKGLLPDVARQLPEALQTKGDISIPVEDYATHLAGSKLDAELLPQLKTSPDGMTLNESRVFQEQQADRMKQDAVDLVKNKDEEAGFRQSQEKVEGNIKAQLDALNRFPPDVNRIYAKVQAAILSRVAAREGMSPEEAYTTYGSAVSGEPPPAGAEGLEGSAMGQGVLGTIKDIAVKADIAANRVIGGEPGETLSARAGREKDNSKVARAAAAALDTIIPGHTDRAQIATAARQRAMGLFQEGGDPLYNNAVSHTGQRGVVSVSHLVRQYGIKWDRADALVKRMEAEGYITPKAPEEGSVVTKDAQGNWTTKQGITNKYLGQYDATDKAKSFLYQSAFHGSPYNFDKFTLDHIGKGEGAQAFGWGLYFAGDKKVAEYYRDTLSKGYKPSDEYIYKGKTASQHYDEAMNAGKYGDALVWERVQLHESKAILRERFEQDAKEGNSQAKAALKLLEKLPDDLFAKPSGQLYEVDIPEADQMLDWDKPLSEQPEAVKKALGNIVDLLNEERGTANSKHPDLTHTGSSIYGFISNAQGGDEAASKFLHSIGIQGIKYLDQGSRAKGDGTHNYVVFDDNAINILKKYYQSGVETAEPRGFYSTLDRSISLLKNANLSTYLHETGHWALDMYSNLAADALAHPEIKADMDQILKWFGVKDIDTWNKMSLSEQRPYHEQFARGFESYLMEGKAPSMELRPAFQRIRAWMTSIYQSLKNLNVELTPEVRGVFDRMLASDEAIEDAEVARGYMLPEVKPENISGPDWETLTKLQAQAHADAVDELQAKSVRDMQWLSNLKGKKVRELNREAAEQRKGVQAEVEKQVDQMPVYKAEKWLKTGETTAEDGEEVKALKGFKLNTDDVRRMFETLPEDQRIAPADLKDMTSPEGLHPDMVAEMFGFSSGEKLLTELAGREPRESVVEGMTDQKMLEEHGELSSPQAINEAANAAVANAARTRFTATLMRVMAKSPIPTRTLVNGAKEAADAAIGQKKVGDLRPAQYDRQEAQANKQRMKLMATDPAGAFDAQRAALLNGQLGIAAREAQADMQDLLKVQAKYDKKSIRTKMDPDILDQIDALRDRFDFRKNPTPDKKVQQLSQWVDSQKALGYSPVESEDMLNPAVRTHYNDMTVDQMRGLLDTLKSMEKLARGRRTLTVEGQQRDLQEVVAEMNEKMKARGEKFTDAQLAEKPRRGIDPAWRVALDRTEAWLRGAGADMKAQHFKANQYDLHQIMGPFHRYLFEPVFGANYKFLDLRREVSNDFREAAKKLGGREWQHSLMDVVENHNLMDNSLETPTKRRLTRGDLIGMALHVGNESNFDKLAQGMGWKPEDIWRALHDNMRREDWEAARVLGEASGKHWDDQVQMNRNMGNTMPEKIQPRPFMTKFGEMPGWYAPVRYDPIRSRLAKKQAAARAVNPAEGLFSKTYYRADTTTNGSLNARVAGYHDFIDLDWHATEQAIHDSLRDLAYREALVNAHKVWANNDFRRQFMRTYGPEAYDSLGEWLGRIVNNEAGDERTNRFVHFMAATRRAVVASDIALRISTMLKHGGSAGIKSMGYFAGGGEKYFLARVKGIALDHGAQVAEALAKFPEIRARAEQQDRDFNQTISSLMEPESVHAKAERFGHAGVATLDFLTAVPTAHAAYDWATTEGIPKRLGGTGQPMSHADAVKFASSMVREAHGTNIESGRSNLINTRSELLKTLTVLHGFMNNAWGQNLDAIDKMRMKEFGKPEIAARYLMAMIVPGLMVGAVTEGLPDKQKEGWAHWTASAIGGEYAATVPLLRDMYAQVAKGYHEAGLPPFFKAFAQLAKPIEDVKNAAQGKEVKAPVKDVANAGGLLLPGLSQIGATSQFLIDEHTGKQKAETVGDWMRGLMTGTAKKHD